MKQTKEFEGKNTDQAIENACAALNVTKRNLIYDIISSGSSGIFGIVGVKKARIRVTLPETDKANPQTNKKNMDSNDSNGVMSIVDEAFGEKKDITPVSDSVKEKSTSENKKSTGKYSHKRSNKRDRPDWSVKKTDKYLNPDGSVRKDKIGKSDKPGCRTDEKTVNSVKPVIKKDMPAVQSDISDMVDDKPALEHAITIENDDNNYNGGTGINIEIDTNNETDTKNNTWNEGFPPKYKNEVTVDVSDESIAIGKEVLQKMVDLITNDAIVVADTDKDKLLLKIEGGNSGVLIGRRGQTLEAMQFLCDKIINRKSEFRVRLKLDIEGYMETRKANLETLASKMANKAKKTGRPATINQMTAQDRRIIHLALKNDSAVRTQSMGEGYYRRLVIFPKRASFRKNNQVRKK